MSNAVTMTGIELYSNKVISGLTRALAALKGFSLNFTDELKEPGSSIDVPLISADVAADWDATSNNFSRDGKEMKKITLNKLTPVIAGYNVSATQYANLRPSFWQGKGELNVDEVADSILSKVAALITADNYGDEEGDKISVTEAGFNRKAVAKIRASAIAKKLRLNRSTLGLSPAYFSALLGDLDANVYGGAEAMKTGVIPGLLGFESVVEIPQLEVPGFVAHPDAIGIGSAVFRPVTDRPYESITQVVEPTTGLTLTIVELGDGPSGSLSVTVNCCVAAGVGNEKALLRLVG